MAPLTVQSQPLGTVVRKADGVTGKGIGNGLAEGRCGVQLVIAVDGTGQSTVQIQLQEAVVLPDAVDGESSGGIKGVLQAARMG